MNFATMLFLCVIMPIAIGAYIVIQSRTASRFELVLSAVTPLAFGIVLWSASYAVAASPLFDWNAGKIAPVVAMVRGQPDGYSLYQPRDTGVMTGWIYGPVAALLFLPSAMFRRPTDVIIMAVIINAIFTLAPVFWFHVLAIGKSPVVIVATAVFVVCCLWFESLRRAVFMVTPDGPAPGLATLSCGLLIGPPSTKRFIITACLISLAAWSKQTIVPSLIVAPIYIAFAHDRRTAIRYALIFVLTFAVVSIAMIAVFGWRDLRFHMFTLPRLHPWHKTLAVGMRDWVIDAAIPLVALIVILTLGRKRPVVRGWIMLPMMAVAMLPGSILGYVKAGGFINNFALTNYFIVLAVTAGAGMLIVEHDTRRTRLVLRTSLCAVLFAYAINVALVRRDLAAMASRVANPYSNQQEIAYRFAMAHPGRAYFPWNNLSTLLAEKRLDHFEWGIRDRFDAHLPPSDAQVSAHVSKDVRFVAFPIDAQSEFALNVFPFATKRTTRDDLPGFVVYTRP